MNADELSTLYKGVGSWHGTGRYQYEGNEIKDVLKEILKVGELRPSLDEFDQKRGSTMSVSLARARGYARLYASLYIAPNDLTIGEYHRRVWGSAYFLLSSKALAWLEYFLRPHFVDFKSKAARWAAKFSKKSMPVIGIFTFGGTDIPYNYPIIIGIKRGVYTPTRGSRFVDLHEDRTAKPIALADFTHIEVPERQASGVQEVLESVGCDLPVISLEVGDKYTFR